MVRRKHLILILMIVSLTGCSKYYEAEISYYNAQAMANDAYVSAMRNLPPIAQMTAPDGTVFVVNSTAQIQLPVIKQMDNPALGALKTIVNSTPLSIVAGGWAGSEIIKQSRGHNLSIDGQSSYTDSTSVGNLDQSQQNSTATPTVVDQPSPVVVNPTVVTQPEPVIVQQPEPIIVQPISTAN